MISFTIDTSVFSLSARNGNSSNDNSNTIKFLKRMNSLMELESYPSVTVSFMNRIPSNLRYGNIYPVDVKNRVNKLNTEEINKLKLDISSILDYYCKKLVELERRKTGIYENIPDRYEDPDKKYKNIYYNRDVYPKNNCPALLNVFNIYLGYIAELNLYNDSEEENYIVTNGSNEPTLENITLKFDKNKNSKVSIVSIQKTKKLCPKEKKENIEEIKNVKFDNIIKGNDVNFRNINFNNTNKTYISTKLYYYLKTLDDIAGIINEKKINENNLICLLNAHGCLCSPDNERYKDCPKRQFKNEVGKEEYFSLHLKPFTKTTVGTCFYTLGGRDYNFTLRIYFRLRGKKMLIGWIGEHPDSCDECERKKKCIKENNRTI